MVYTPPVTEKKHYTVTVTVEEVTETDGAHKTRNARDITRIVKSASTMKDAVALAIRHLGVDVEEDK